MNRITRRTLLSVWLLLVTSFAFAQDAKRDVKLTILHTNDTHGHLLPFSYPDVVSADSMVSLVKVRRNIGGSARRATLIKRLKAENKNTTLVIDAGDICDGTPFSTEYHGDADIAAMNAIGYDMACPGNHEYNNTPAQVRKLVGEAKFPLLSANSTVKGSKETVYTPYVIKEIDGIKIAFFGLLTYDARTYPAAKEAFEMEKPIDTAKRLVPELKKQADLVIAVTHIGVEDDIELAAAVPGIDVIVGAHSHTLVPKPLLIPHPTDLRPNSVHGTIVVQAHQWGGLLGKLNLTFHKEPNASWTVSKYDGELLPVTAALPEDEHTAAVVAKYWEPIKAKYGAEIGKADADFTEIGNNQAEYNLVADAVREQMGVEFDMENQGGVRAPIVRGVITYGDMINVDPFGNTIVLFKATGKQIKAILAKDRPAVSGIRYVYERGELKEATIGGKPIEDDKVYSGATNNYIARFILEGITDKTDTKKPRLDSVIAYIKAKGTVKPAYDGRRIVKTR